MSNQIYVILTSAEADDVVFSEVGETSADTLRWNNEKTETVVKFSGSTPSFLEGKTQYTHAEILTILSGSDWTPPDPTG